MSQVSRNRRDQIHGGRASILATETERGWFTETELGFLRRRQSQDLIWSSMYDKYSCSAKITTHLDDIRHCKAPPGTNWSKRWTDRVFIISTRRDYIFASETQPGSWRGTAHLMPANRGRRSRSSAKMQPTLHLPSPQPMLDNGASTGCELDLTHNLWKLRPSNSASNAPATHPNYSHT
jgi:hypothetical protein